MLRGSAIGVRFTVLLAAAIVAGRGLMIESPDSAHAVRVVPLRPGFTAARRYTIG